MTPASVKTGYGIFAVEDTGPSGIPVVLLHGAIANLRAWDGVTPSIGSRFRCVSIDLPAHGWSSVELLRFTELGAALVEICDNLQLEAPFLVGHSFGGLAAVAASARYPGRFSGVMAIDPYLSNREVRRVHDSVEQAMQEVRDQPWPWGVVSDIGGDIDRAIDTLYAPGRDEDVLRATLKRGYREQADGTFLRYPRKEDELAAIGANWNLDVDGTYDNVASPLALALATKGVADVPEKEREARFAQRRATVERLKPHVEVSEFACGHDIVGFMPTQLADYIVEWVQRAGR